MNDAKAAINAIRDEALRKIGRNVVLFQELENILKFLASAQHPSMPMSKAKATREGRAKSIRIKTLGQVAGQVIEELFAASDAESSAPAEITEPWLTFSFRIAAEPGDLEESRRTVKALIDERNDLVHHLCNALSAQLDEQRLRIIAEIERYRVYASTARGPRKKIRVKECHICG